MRLEDGPLGMQIMYTSHHYTGIQEFEEEGGSEIFTIIVVLSVDLYVFMTLLMANSAVGCMYMYV